MLSIIKSLSLNGLDGYLVYVQVDVAAGLPSWEIVGLPDISIRESKERVRTAIKNSEIDFPSRKIVVNLAPANSKKEGVFFDLPIAIAILVATEHIKCENIDEYAFIGELSLDGKILKARRSIANVHRSTKIRNKKTYITKRKYVRSKHCKRYRNISSKNFIGCNISFKWRKFNRKSYFKKCYIF